MANIGGTANAYVAVTLILRAGRALSCQVKILPSVAATRKSGAASDIAVGDDGGALGVTSPTPPAAGLALRRFLTLCELGRPRDDGGPFLIPPHLARIALAQACILSASAARPVSR